MMWASKRPLYFDRNWILSVIIWAYYTWGQKLDQSLAHILLYCFKKIPCKDKTDAKNERCKAL